LFSVASREASVEPSASRPVRHSGVTGPALALCAGSGPRFRSLSPGAGVLVISDRPGDTR
jgi:hypothetical protein